MNVKRTIWAASTVAITMAAMGVTPGVAQPGGGDGDPVTLRMAVADDELRPASSYARAFADEVAGRSAGALTIELEWDAGASTPQGFEQGVAHLLVDGQADLALSAGRAWHDTGIASLLPLQAPFLIADDALAVAVATSPIADDMLAGMSDHGVVGLALWPEDLRHLAAFEPCSEPIISPEQLEGLTVRAIPSAITLDILDALGATHTFDDETLVGECAIQAAESGLLQGAGLPIGATFTGDITFFPKYQVLAANAEAFDALSPDQQALIREAAMAIGDRAVAEHPTDVEAAEEWCAAGGHVVMAGPNGVAAFEQAVQPVYDQLAQDPLVASAIAAIRELGQSVTPSPGATACEPPLADPVAVDVASELPEPGTWRIEQSEETLLAMGIPPTEAYAWAGVITMHFDGAEGWTMVHVQGPDQVSLTCVGTYRLEGDLLYVGFTMDAHSDCGPGSGGYGIWIPEGPGRALFRNPPGIADDLLTGVWTKVD